MKRKTPRIALQVEIPRPCSRRPWHRKPNLPPVYDADDKVVSFIENAPFLFHVEQCFDPLTVALSIARKQLLAARRWTALEHQADEITDTLKIVNAVLKKARGKL